MSDTHCHSKRILNKRQLTNYRSEKQHNQLTSHFAQVSESENGDLLIKNTERNQTIFIGASVRSMIGQSGQKIKLISRKVSSFERQDIDSNLIKKLVISFVGFMLISYSIQIFFQLLPVIYPAYQTIKSLQVLNKKSPWASFSIAKKLKKH